MAREFTSSGKASSDVAGLKNAAKSSANTAQTAKCAASFGKATAKYLEAKLGRQSYKNACGKECRMPGVLSQDEPQGQAKFALHKHRQQSTR